MTTSPPLPKSLPIGPRRRPSLSSFASRLFGYDVFISFALGGPPRGTQNYASDLARRLRECDLSVFFSEEEALPGSPLGGTLTRALLRAKLLVVVVRRGTLEVPRWVRTEVETYRKGRPGRPIIPVCLDDSLRDATLSAPAQEWLCHADHIWLDEQPESAAAGLASDELVARLLTAPHRLQSNTLWRSAVAAVVLGLAALAVALWMAMLSARTSERLAREELVRAVALSLVSRSQTRLTSVGAAHDDERALLEAVTAQRLVEDREPIKEVLDGLWNALESKREWLATVPITRPSAPFARIEGHRVSDIAWSPDGSRWLVAEGDALRIRQSSDGAPIGLPIAPSAEPRQWRRVRFAPDGRTLLLLDETGRLLRWDFDAGTGLSLLPSQPGNATDEGEDVSLAPDGRSAWVVSGGGEARLTNIPLWPGTGTPRVVSIPGWVRRVAVDPTGTYIALGGWYSSIEQGNTRFSALWVIDTRSGRVMKGPLPAFEYQDVGAVAWSPDGMTLAAGDGGRYQEGFHERGSGAVGIWDVKTGRLRGPLVKGHAAQVRSLVASPSGSHFWSGSFDGTLRSWSATDGRPLGPALRGHRDAVLGIALSPDGRRLVSSSDDGSLRLWQVEGAMPLPTKEEPVPPALAGPRAPRADPVSDLVAVQPSGTLVATYEGAGHVTVRDAATGQTVWQAQHADLAALQFIEGGRTLAAVFSDGRQLRWRSSDGEALTQMPRLASVEPMNPLFSLRFSISETVYALLPGLPAS